MKILILTQGLSNSEMETLKKGVSEVKKLLPQLEFFYKETSRKYSSIPVDNGIVKGYILNNPEILQEVSGDFDIACLVYDWTTITPQPTNPATSLMMKGRCIPMAIPKQWYNEFIDTFVIYFLHELSHAEAFRYSKEDKTENFYTSPFAQTNDMPLQKYYLSLLKEVWKSNPLIATLTRTQDTGKETLGKLVCQNGGAKFTCDTLELSWKKNKKNISSIPTGMYICKYTFSPRFMKWTYEVQKVSNRSGIRLHSANYHTELNGCIALGIGLKDINNDGQLDVISSKVAIKALEGFYQKREFILKII